MTFKMHKIILFFSRKKYGLLTGQKSVDIHQTEWRSQGANLGPLVHKAKVIYPLPHGGSISNRLSEAMAIPRWFLGNIHYMRNLYEKKDHKYSIVLVCSADKVLVPLWFLRDMPK